ncbi:MAG: HEPN domain-containing protein [Candidatus Atribacteria bacterium]|nr:HEPN domain-containing protein [Candidatus Atribacteria bacterium]
MRAPFLVKSSILFGSSACGTQTRDSDVDILVVSDEIPPQRQRRSSEIAYIKNTIDITQPLDVVLLTSQECISNFRNHNPLFLDIAIEGHILFDEGNFLKNLIDETKKYIRERGIEKTENGWKFPVPYRSEGYLSEVSNRQFADARLDDAKRDYDIGVIILEKGYFDKAVFHFQQSVEKSMKAILIMMGIFIKSHFIGKALIKEIEEKQFPVPWKDALIHIARMSIEIEPEVTWSRYPGIDNNILWIPAEEYFLEDANRAKEKCQKILKTSQEFYHWWFPEKFFNHSQFTHFPNR